MKLLLCTACGDVVCLKAHDRACGCGKTRGRYTEGSDAVYAGAKAVPFAIDNYSLKARVYRKRMAGHQWFYDQLHGKNKVHCWVMQKGNPNFETIKKLSLKRYNALLLPTSGKR